MHFHSKNQQTFLKFSFFFSPWAFSRWLCRCGCSGRTETGLTLRTEGLQTDYHSAGTASSVQRKTGPRTEPPSPAQTESTNGLSGRFIQPVVLIRIFGTLSSKIHKHNYILKEYLNILLKDSELKNEISFTASCSVGCFLCFRCNKINLSGSDVTKELQWWFHSSDERLEDFNPIDNNVWAVLRNMC